MKKYWITSDTHIYHERVKEFCNRPDNFDQLIYKNMRHLSVDDVLIHLGDVAFSNEALAHDTFFKTLKCTKILVRGNHDKRSDSWYYDHGWDFVCLTFRNNYFGKNILFSHKPKVWDGHYDLNIHGHFHNIDIDRWETELTEVMTHRHLLVSIEDNNYELVNLNTLVAMVNKQERNNE